MQAAQVGEARKDKEQPGPEVLKTLIRGHVLRALGEPGGTGRVQVRPLWGDYYRVNVVVGEGPGRFTIARSYFLRADGAGAILESTPKLTRQG
jgi:hypothetical protein